MPASGRPANKAKTRGGGTLQHATRAALTSTSLLSTERPSVPRSRVLARPRLCHGELCPASAMRRGARHGQRAVRRGTGPPGAPTRRRQAWARLRGGGREREASNASGLPAGPGPRTPAAVLRHVAGLNAVLPLASLRLRILRLVVRELLQRRCELRLVRCEFGSQVSWDTQCPIEFGTHESRCEFGRDCTRTVPRPPLSPG